MLLTEHHFEFPSLKGDCTGSSESELTLKSVLYVAFFLFFCHFPIRCSGSGVILIVSIPDICVLPYFLYSHEYRLTRNTVYCAILSDQIVVGCPLGVPISYYMSVIMYYRISKKSDLLNKILLNLNSSCTRSHITLQVCAKNLNF